MRAGPECWKRKMSGICSAGFASIASDRVLAWSSFSVSHTRMWIVSEKKAKQNNRHRNSASIAGEPDQSSSGIGCKDGNSGFAKESNVSFTELSCVSSKSLHVRGGSVTSSSGELRAVRCRWRPQVVMVERDR